MRLRHADSHMQELVDDELSIQELTRYWLQRSRIMEQVTVVKGAYSGYCLRSIQTDFMNPENRKIFSTRLSYFCSFQSENSFPLFLCWKRFWIAWRMNTPMMTHRPMANVTKQLRSKIRPPHEPTFQWDASLEGLQLPRMWKTCFLLH